MKRILSALLCVVLLCALTTFGVMADTPSTWAEKEVFEAIDNRLVPDELQSGYSNGITRRQLSLILYNLLSRVVENPSEGKTVVFSDTEDTYVSFASSLGLINGYKQPDGTYLFKPENVLKRSEMAAIINRVAKLCGKETSGFESEIVFEDTVNHWCVSELGYAVHNGIVKGTSTTTFSPESTLTVEQTIIIINRTYETLKKCNHTFDDGKIEKEATCSVEGSVIKTCLLCGDTVTETLPKTEHLWVAEDENTPLCLWSGVNAVCEVCGEHGVTTERRAHKMSDGLTCDYCNAVYEDEYVTFVLVNRSLPILYTKQSGASHIHQAILLFPEINRNNGEYALTLYFIADFGCRRCSGKMSDNAPNLTVNLYNKDNKLVKSYNDNVLSLGELKVDTLCNFGYAITNDLKGQSGKLVDGVLRDYGHQVYYIEFVADCLSEYLE